MIHKILNIVVALLLILSTTGITLSKHYCGGKLVSVSINKKAENCCGSSCPRCHSESVTLKVSDTFVASSFVEKQVPSVSNLGSWYSIINKPFNEGLFYSELPQTLLKAPPIPISISASFLQVFRC